MRPLQTCRERQTITGLCGNKNHCTVGRGIAPPAVLRVQQYNRSSVGEAYMPPAQPPGYYDISGKIARASNARPYKRRVNSCQPPISLAGWGHPALRGNKNHCAGTTTYRVNRTGRIYASPTNLPKNCRKDGKIGVTARWTNNGGCAIIYPYKIPPLKEKVLW